MRFIPGAPFRLSFQRKLLLAFAAVLLPVVGVLGADLAEDARSTQHTLLEAQGLTAHAVAVQVAESLEAAIDLGWALANDPLVRTLEPELVDAHLLRLTGHPTRFSAIGVYDAQGYNRGWGDPSSPAEPRLWIGDRPFFQQAMATNQPVISRVVQLRRPERTAVIVAVPIRDERGQPVGVIDIVMETRLLAQRYLPARRDSGQEILLVDPDGRLAFHTGAPALDYTQGLAFESFAPLRQALEGKKVQVERATSPLDGEDFLGAFVPLPRYPWAVGVLTSRERALAPLAEQLYLKLAAVLGIALFSGLLAVVLARRQTRPVGQLLEFAQALGEGHLTRRVHIQTGDEMEELGEAFNQMAGHIAQRQSEVDALRGEAEDHARQLAALLNHERALARIGQALVREVTLERLTSVAAEQGQQALGADAVGLWLAWPDTSRCVRMATRGLRVEDGETPEDLPLSALPSASRAVQGEAFALSFALPGLTEAGGGHSPLHGLARREGFARGVLIPLRSRGRLEGVLACFWREPGEPSLSELEFHTTVGRLVAVALEKARLFQEVREALRLREEFMSAAAHELKTPVTTLQTWADILTWKEEGASERQRKGLAAIARGARRLGRLVDHLFTALRLAPGLAKLERDRVDLRALLSEHVLTVSRTTDIPIHLEAGEAPIIEADRQRMGEVMAHLLENAIRYSPPARPIEVRLGCAGNQAVVSIRDQGPGIPLERQPHVFEPLYEPLPSGAAGYVGMPGLGLHLSSRIIEAHGGRIWLESQPGEGTTFCFSLPLHGVDSPRHANA